MARGRGQTKRRLIGYTGCCIELSAAVIDALRPIPVGCQDPITPWPLGAVNTAAFSPDGTEVALGCSDGSVALCSTSKWRLRAILGKHPERVWSLAYSPDGSTLAATGGDGDGGTRKGFVTLWDVATGRELGRLARACETELAVAFSPNGETLASGGRDRVVKLWDVKTRVHTHPMPGPRRDHPALAFHPRRKGLYRRPSTARSASGILVRLNRMVIRSAWRANHRVVSRSHRMGERSPRTPARDPMVLDGPVVPRACSSCGCGTRANRNSLSRVTVIPSSVPASHQMARRSLRQEATSLTSAR